MKNFEGPLDQTPSLKQEWVEIDECVVSTFAEIICMEQEPDATCIEEETTTEFRDGRIIRRTKRRMK